MLLVYLFLNVLVGVSMNMANGLFDKNMELSMQELIDLKEALGAAISELETLQDPLQEWKVLEDKINKEIFLCILY